MGTTIQRFRDTAQIGNVGRLSIVLACSDGILGSPEYSRRPFWRDPAPAAEGFVWASGNTDFSSSVSGLLTADLQCDLKPHSGNPVSQDLAPTLDESIDTASNRVQYSSECADQSKPRGSTILETDFRPLLISCLRECKSGCWGLFGQNDDSEGAKYLDWKDSKNLNEIAQQIHDLRSEFGQPNPLVDRFLHHCSLRGPNVPGEPKLAKAFLDEIEKGDSITANRTSTVGKQIAVSEKQFTGLRPDGDGRKRLCTSLKIEQLSGHFLRSPFIRIDIRSALILEVLGPKI